MFWVYILHSEVYDKYYIGFTHDIDKRVIAHNHPKNKGYTRKYGPWKLIYTKSFEYKEDAMKYENYLKSLKSKITLGEIIKMNK